MRRHVVLSVVAVLGLGLPVAADEAYRRQIEADWQQQDACRMRQIVEPGLVRFPETELQWPGTGQSSATAGLVVPQAAAPKLDGRLDDPCWATALVPPPGPPDEQVQPKFRLLHDGKRYWIAAAFPTQAEPCFGQVTTAQDAGGAVDGIKNGRYGFHTGQEPNPWWQVDLGSRQPVTKVVVYNRMDYPPGLHNADHLVLSASDDGKTWTPIYENKGKPFGGVDRPLAISLSSAGARVDARFLRIQLPSPTPIFLHFDEVEVFGVDANKNIALGQPADQSSRSPWSRGGALCTIGQTPIALAGRGDQIQVTAGGKPLSGDRAALVRDGGTTTVEIALPLEMLGGLPDRFAAYHAAPVALAGKQQGRIGWPASVNLGHGKNRLTLTIPAEAMKAGQTPRLVVETVVFTPRRPDRQVVLDKPIERAGPVEIEFTIRHEGAAAVVATFGSPGGGVREGRAFFVPPVIESLDRAALLSREAVPNADAALAGQIESLRAQVTSLAAAETRDGPQREARDKLYGQARWLARRVAFVHPAMQFTQLLFVKRFTQQSYPDVCLNHMPWVSRPGGDLCVLTFAGPDEPGAVRNVIAGQLGPGHVHGMDLSWNADRIVFAYAKAKSNQPPAGWLDRSQSFRLRREEEPTHLFEIGVDGTRLRQLTSGQWSDLDPTYLPSDDVCFVSERCGYSLQCNEYDKDETSTNLYLLRQKPGSPPDSWPEYGEIRRLSVTKDGDYLPHTLGDGTIGYTRWEYQERGWANIQSLWFVRPDGTGADALFKQHFNDPWAVEDCRSLPGSTRLVGVATGHHTLPAGPVIVINPRDGMNSPRGIRIVTPGVLPPEGGMTGRTVDEGGVLGTGGFYMNPWPLSQTQFLVASTFAGQYRVTGETDERGYALYLIDVHGTKELIYRDPSISCFMPIPLRPRPRPPVLPDTTDPKQHYAVCSVSDIGKGVPGVDRRRIKYLRISHGVAWPYCNTYGGQRYEPDVKSVMINWNPARIIGEVPVEPDGSVQFRVPVDTPVYFQLLDERRQELRRMRSFISFQPGEVRGCVGCHETREEAGAVAVAPRAFLKEPLDPVPPPWRDRTLSFLRDVQPVFDRHCAGCHGGLKSAAGLDFSGGLTPRHNRAYDTILQHKLIAWSNVGEDARVTMPLEFGSHRSRLVQWLREGACGKRVKLTDDDWYRLVAWIDCNGPYHDEFINKRLPEMPYELPADAQLATQLAAVHARRCTNCHAAGEVTRLDWIDLRRPSESRFLAAPLAKEASGWGKCREPVYRDANDPDYRAVRALIEAAVQKAWQRPRRDLKALLSGNGSLQARIE